MKRRGFQSVVWFAGLLAFASGAEVATAAQYYTATYVGKSRDVEYYLRGDGSDVEVANRATGVAYFIGSGTTFLGDDPSLEALGLPKATVMVGEKDPRPETFTMQGYSINPSTGTVVGAIPSGQSDEWPWSPVIHGYATRDEDGAYSEFHVLTTAPGAAHSIYLNSNDQILIQETPAGWTMHQPYSVRLIDLKSGVETPLEDLMTPEFWARYGRWGVEYLTSRGDVLLATFPRGLDGGLDFSQGDTYILTPPGVDPPTPVPEPSLLWLAAGAIGVGVRARWRKSRGA